MGRISLASLRHTTQPTILPFITFPFHHLLHLIHRINILGSVLPNQVRHLRPQTTTLVVTFYQTSSHYDIDLPQTYTFPIFLLLYLYYDTRLSSCCQHIQNSFIAALRL